MFFFRLLPASASSCYCIIVIIIIIIVVVVAAAAATAAVHCTDCYMYKQSASTDIQQSTSVAGRSSYENRMLWCHFITFRCEYCCQQRQTNLRNTSALNYCRWLIYSLRWPVRLMLNGHPTPDTHFPIHPETVFDGPKTDI